jgi:hypothetical protein
MPGPAASRFFGRAHGLNSRPSSGCFGVDREWRQLATFEAVNGWIIFGWATALIMAVIQRLYFTK